MPENYITKEYFDAAIERLEANTDAKIEALAEAVREGFAEHGKILSQHGQQLSQQSKDIAEIKTILVTMDQRVARLETQMSDVGQAIDRLEEKVGRLQKMESEDVQAAYDEISALRKRQDELEMQVRDLQARYEVK